MLVNQPADSKLGDMLNEKLQAKGKRAFDQVYIMVAYVRRSGVLNIERSMQQFRKRGGRVEVVAGVDNGNTSAEGLGSLGKIVDRLLIYHDEMLSNSFHPKAYVFMNEGKNAFVIVGSNNLTGGGLYTNYEIFSSRSYDLTDKHQNDGFEKVMRAIRKYSDITSPCCKVYSDKLLRQLKARKMVAIEEEDNLLRARKRRAQKRFPPLFGTEKHEGAPVHHNKSRRDEVEQKGFWKVLSEFDVSRTSSPGQIQIPMEFLTFFPRIRNYHKTKKASLGDVYFDVLYKEDRARERKVKNARLIHYIPAPTHARKNEELRFTFKNVDVARELRKGDILEFNSSENPRYKFVVTLVPAKSAVRIIQNHAQARWGYL